MVLAAASSDRRRPAAESGFPLFSALNLSFGASVARQGCVAHLPPF